MIAAASLMVAWAPLDAAPGPAPSWFYDPWRTNHGLPNNDVTGVCQASDGALMVSTLSGLVRFDGLRFRPIRPGTLTVPGGVAGVCAGPQEGVWFVEGGRLVEWRGGKGASSLLLPGLGSGAKLTALFANADDTVWLSFERGPIYYCKGGEVMTAATEEGLGLRFVSTVAKDAKGNVWAAGNGVLAKWDGRQFARYAAIPYGGGVAMTGAGEGGLWIGVGTHLLRFAEEGGFKPVGRIDGLFDRARISTMLEDSRGDVWCGTIAGGLHCWVGDRFERVNIAHHDVWALMEDVEQNIWVGTGGNGLVRVRLRVLKALDEPGGPLAQTPRSIARDATNRLWVVTQTGDVYSREGTSWRRLNLQSDLHTREATCVTADAAGNVWIACAESKLVKWDGSAFHEIALPERTGNKRVYAMMAAKDGSLWIGRGGELLHQIGESWRAIPPGAEGGLICTMTQDRAGVIWVGTTVGTVLRVSGDRLRDSTPPEVSGGVRTVAGGPAGSVWVGNGEGLWRIKDGKSVQVASCEELGVGAISQITFDERRRMWAGVDQGVLVVSSEELEKRADGSKARLPCSYYLSGGYQLSSGYWPNTVVAPGGWLWFCSRAGLLIANANEAGSNTVAPRPSIEALKVNGQEMPLEAGLALRPSPSQINFELGAMSFRFPEDVRLYYRIEGVDPGWVNAGKDRLAHYASLPPGPHVLQVRAVNEDGTPSERYATFAFEVIPSFWETVPFRVVVSLLAAGSLVLLVRVYMVRNLRRETESLREQVAVNGERVRIARDMHDQLGASLTQISLLADLMVAEGSADKHLGQLARTARQASTSLDEIVWAVNPRHDHLGSVLEYLAQQVVNLVEPAGLRCRLALPEEVPDRHLPAEFRHQLFLIVREAVNNVIKHAGAREVAFSAHVNPSTLSLVVSDDGSGGATAARGDGLQNMRARAESLGGECRIHSATGKGTSVELQVPWPPAPRSL